MSKVYRCKSYEELQREGHMYLPDQIWYCQNEIVVHRSTKKNTYTYTTGRLEGRSFMFWDGLLAPHRDDTLFTIR